MVHEAVTGGAALARWGRLSRLQLLGFWLATRIPVDSILLPENKTLSNIRSTVR